MCNCCDLNRRVICKASKKMFTSFCVSCGNPSNKANTHLANERLLACFNRTPRRQIDCSRIWLSALMGWITLQHCANLWETRVDRSQIDSKVCAVFSLQHFFIHRQQRYLQSQCLLSQMLGPRDLEMRFTSPVSCVISAFCVCCKASFAGGWIRKQFPCCYVSFLHFYTELMHTRNKNSKLDWAFSRRSSKDMKHLRSPAGHPLFDLKIS